METPLSAKSRKILIVAGLTLTVFLIYQMAKRKKAIKKKLTIVSDEGYETAEDILFPNKRFMRLS